MTIAIAPADVLGRLTSVGVPVPRAVLCRSVAEAMSAAEDLAVPVALKAAGLVHKSGTAA